MGDKYINMTRRQKYATATIIVVILLIAFLWYYFRSRKKGERCPDGRSIPSTGNCADNEPIRDSTGAVVVTPTVPDSNGCVQPSSYVTNYFPLELGMKGDTVKQLQASLNIQFKSNIVEDGYFGCRTFDALKKTFNIETVDLEFFKNNIQGSVPLGIPAASIYETPTT